jgi:hypothetical protein
MIAPVPSRSRCRELSLRDSRPLRESRRAAMALDVGLQHAVSGSRSQSGFSIPSPRKGRCPVGTRHLTPKIARPARIGLPHTSSQRPTSARRVGAYTWRRERRGASRCPHAPAWRGFRSVCQRWWAARSLTAQTKTRAASVAAAATMSTWVVEQRSISCLR